MNISRCVENAFTKNEKVVTKMEFSKLKVGQIVEHDNGFIGEIVEIRHTEGAYPDIDIKVTDVGVNGWRTLGEIYTAMPEFINRIVKDVHQFKAVADLEFTGIEKLEELVAQATEALEILSDATPFKANIQGMEFEGTPAQFESFMATMTKYLGNLS
jgi:hypothetical protein